MLTAGGGGGPITIGSFSSGGGLGQWPLYGLIVNLNGPSAGFGTVTKFRVMGGSAAGDFYAVIGYFSTSSTFVARSVSPQLSITSAQSYEVREFTGLSMAAQTGDYAGIVVPSSSGFRLANSTGMPGGNIRYAANRSSGAPSAGSSWSTSLSNPTPGAILATNI